MMTVEQGDGTMAKRIALGLCPKCETALDPGPATVCRCCGLQIGGVLKPTSSTPLVDIDDVISNSGSLQ
jgi:ribosomal protein L40E